MVNDTKDRNVKVTLLVTFNHDSVVWSAKPSFISFLNPYAWLLTPDHQISESHDPLVCCREG